MVAHFGHYQPGANSWGRCMCACMLVLSSADGEFTSKTRNLDERLKAKCPNAMKHVQKKLSPMQDSSHLEMGMLNKKWKMYKNQTKPNTKQNKMKQQTTNKQKAY